MIQPNAPDPIILAIQELLESAEGFSWLSMIVVGHSLNMDEAEPVQRSVLEGEEPSAEDLHRFADGLRIRANATRRVAELLHGLARGVQARAENRTG